VLNTARKICPAYCRNLFHQKFDLKEQQVLKYACYHSVQSLLSSCFLSQNVNIKIYKTIILAFVLYACETWSLTLREEHMLRVFENRVLRIIFAPKREEVVRGWRKLHNEKHHNLYPSPSVIKVMK